MENIRIDSDSYAIPFNEVRRLIESLPYASESRVIIEILALTGCRISELDNLRRSQIYGNWIIWKPGKNQTRIRKEKLPDWFMKELKIYLSQTSFKNDKLFSLNHTSFRRRFNAEIRPILGGDWLIKRMPKLADLSRGALRYEYLYQLKSFRHNFATLHFYNHLDKWGAEVAIAFTCKRLKHSSYKMTADHYIENFEELNIKDYLGMDMEQIIRTGHQTRLIEFT